MSALPNASGGLDFTALVDDRPGDGVFRVDRSVYTDARVFEVELERIFERTRRSSSTISLRSRPMGSRWCRAAAVRRRGRFGVDV